MTRTTLDDFFYELFAYVVPGFLLCHTFITIINFPSCTDISLLYKLTYLKYSTLDVIGFIIVSAIFGQLFTLLTTSLGAKKRFLFFNNAYGIYRLISSPKKYPRHYKITVDRFVAYFGLDFPAKKHLSEDYVSALAEAMYRFLEENSTITRPIGRYHARMVCAKNLAAAILFSTVLIVSRIEATPIHSIMLIAIGILCCILLVVYAKHQALWRFEYIIARLTILLKECAGSENTIEQSDSKRTS